mmetsp:Transcript_81962/g.258619  ORF Transcript_81962/g.258619 Transcript_81962/m.258619 type:complete len:205 (+) Transcript_81962:524-1138(+)
MSSAAHPCLHQTHEGRRLRILVAASLLRAANEQRGRGASLATQTLTALRPSRWQRWPSWRMHRRRSGCPGRGSRGRPRRAFSTASANLAEHLCVRPVLWQSCHLRNAQIHRTRIYLQGALAGRVPSCQRRSPVDQCAGSNHSPPQPPGREDDVKPADGNHGAASYSSRYEDVHLDVMGLVEGRPQWLAAGQRHGSRWHAGPVRG